MIVMNKVDEILDRLEKETNIPKQDLLDRVSKKQHEFSGLISYEGATHLVAKDLGINLLTANNRKLEIKNVSVGMKNVNIVGRVFKISGIVEFKRSDGSKGRVVNVFVGDNTGFLKVSLWDKQVSMVEQNTIKLGDAIQIKNGLAKESLYGGLELTIGKYGNIEIVENGIELPLAEELNKKFFGDNTTEKVSVKNLVAGVFEVSGTVIDVLKTNFIFNTCALCGKALEKTNSGGKCAEHGEVESVPALVINTIIDDGTGSLRTVFFRETAERFCGISANELVNFDLEKRYNKIADSVVGRLVSVKGNVKKNKMFDRMEMMVNEFKDLNTSDESKKLIDAIEIKIGE